MKSIRNKNIYIRYFVLDAKPAYNTIIPGAKLN